MPPQFSRLSSPISDRTQRSSTSLAGSPDILPRLMGRRNRHQCSELRERNSMGITKSTELVAWNAQPQAAPPSTLPQARVTAYCTCEQIELFTLLKWLESEKPMERATFLCLSGWKNKMYTGVVHSSYRPMSVSDRELSLHQQKDAFYFASGCCVFWGLSPEEELQHTQAITPFCVARVAQATVEDMEFEYGEDNRVSNDGIVLSSDAAEEKLAISFAMAQSVKLDVFEQSVENRIRNTKHIPMHLAKTGVIKHSQKEISKLIGQLFIEIADVNLHSDILDEPDFFWEDEEYEPLFKGMAKYLDVSNRVRVLNKRLDILRELLAMLNQQLGQRKSVRQEWIIIWLIAVEILIFFCWDLIVKDIFGYFNH